MNLTCIDSIHKAEVKRILEESAALDGEYIVCVIFKDDLIHTKSTPGLPTTRLKGALEIAKHHVITRED